MTIGERFKEAREEKELTLKEIQESIKIRSRYLEAIESNSFDIIPGEAYVKAFIKSYANFLDLDYNEILEQYKEVKAEEKRKTEQLQEEEEESNKATNSLLHNKTLISSIIIAVIIIVLVFLIYNVFLLNDSKNDISRVSNNNSFQAVADDVNQESLNEENVLNDVVNSNNTNNTVNQKEISENINKNSSNLNNEDFQNNSELNHNGDNNTAITENEIFNSNNLTPEGNNQKSQKIDIIAVEKSWVQILVDGEIVYEGIFEKGDNRSYTYRENVSLKIGNAAGIKVRKGNRVLGPWGEKGEVIKKTIEY